MTDKHKKDWGKIKKDHPLYDEDLEGFDLDDTESEEEESSEAASLDHPSYLELEEKLTLAEQKAHENWEKAMRAMSELDNVRKRAERDIANAHRYGIEKLLQALIPIVDSLEQALNLAEGNAAMHEGLELTLKLFLDVLKKNEVEQINPVGEPFDPQTQEAMSIQDSQEVPPNHVIVVFQKGYKLNDRVIRPARVIVSKN